MEVASRNFSMGENRFRQGVEHRHARIKRRIRVLKDHLEIGARPAKLAALESIQIPPFQYDAQKVAGIS